MVSSSKLNHWGRDGATVCFLPVLARTKDGGSSPSRHCVVTSSLAHFRMRIEEMWLVLQNRSICIKREPPCVRGLFWPKGRTRTLLFPVIAWKLPLLLTFARGSKNCPQNSSICLKTGTPYVYSLFFWPKGTMGTLLFLVIAWKLPLLLTFARGFMNCG